MVQITAGWIAEWILSWSDSPWLHADEGTPMLSESSMTISELHVEVANPQSVVTEKLAHLSTAPLQTGLPSQGPSTSPGVPAAVAGPSVSMDACCGKAAAVRKQAPEEEPAPEAVWDAADGLPDEKRLFTVRFHRVEHGI